MAQIRWLPRGKKKSPGICVKASCGFRTCNSSASCPIISFPIIHEAVVKPSPDPGRGNLPSIRKRKALGASDQSNWLNIEQSGMPLATIISTSPSHRPRLHTYSSYPLQYQTYEGTSVSTISDFSPGVEKSVTRGPRYFRVDPRISPPQERRSSAKRAMSSHHPRRTHSDSKSKTKETHGKEPRVVDRDVRRKSDSEHRHSHRRSEKEDAREGGGVRVHRVHRTSEGERDRSRSSTVRRSTTNAGEAGKRRHERQRTEDGEMRRKHSERRPSHHEEKVSTSLRHEKRSIADHVPKSPGDRAPVTR